jgi:8-oxo-dGTP diphosphatase
VTAPIAAAIIVKDGLVLMIRRRVPEGQLSWQFPSGKIEPGETGEEAAVRETAEEVGLTVGVLRRLGERVHPLTGADHGVRRVRGAGRHAVRRCR